MYTRLDLSTILMHLSENSYAAKDVIGVYPLFSDRTCRFLVFDFDNHEKDAEKRDFANIDDFSYYSCNWYMLESGGM